MSENQIKRPSDLNGLFKLGYFYVKLFLFSI